MRILLFPLLLVLAGCADRQSPPDLAEVRTWGDLLARPPITLADGTVVRLGIEAHRGPPDAGPLVYCLSDRRGAPQGQRLTTGGPCGPLYLDEPWAPAVADHGVFRRLPDDQLFLYCYRTRPPAVAGQALLRDGPRVVASFRLVRAGSSPGWLAISPAVVGGSQARPADEPEPLAIDGLYPALPCVESQEPFITARATLPPMTPLPRSFPSVPDGLAMSLAWREDGLWLHLEGELVDEVAAPESLLLRWWIDDRTYAAPPRKVEEIAYLSAAPGTRDGRCDLLLTGLPAELAPRTGRRIECQAAWCQRGWQAVGELPYQGGAGPDTGWSRPLLVSARMVVPPP